MQSKAGTGLNILRSLFAALRRMGQTGKESKFFGRERPKERMTRLHAAEEEGVAVGSVEGFKDMKLTLGLEREM